MDPSRPLLGRGALISSSIRGAAAIFLVTLLHLPISLSPASPHLEHAQDQEQEQPSSCDPSSPLDCADPQLFYLMMRSAINAFPTVHFSRFARPVPGEPPLLLRHGLARPLQLLLHRHLQGLPPLPLVRDPATCAYSVTSIGGYHSGPNARKPRPGASNATAPPPPPSLSRSQFAAGRYLAYLIEDTRVTSINFSKGRDTLIVRKFRDVEAGNYWYHVCEGEAERVLRPPRRAIRWAPSLMRIVDAIISGMQADFDAVHVGGDGEDLRRRIEEEGVDRGRRVYVAGEGIDGALVEVLKARWHGKVHHLDEFQELWGRDSKWFLEMRRLNAGVPVEFDGYMRELVDREVFLKGKKKTELLR